MEVPEGDACADEVGQRSHRGRPGAGVDQPHLTEVVAGLERPALDAVDVDDHLTGGAHEECGRAGALLDDGLALGERLGYRVRSTDRDTLMARPPAGNSLA